MRWALPTLLAVAVTRSLDSKGLNPLITVTEVFNKKTAIARSQFVKKVRIKERKNHSKIGQRWFHEWLGIWTKSRVV